MKLQYAGIVLFSFALACCLLPHKGMSETAKPPVKFLPQSLTPEATLRAFVKAFNGGDTRTASALILNAKPSMALDDFGRFVKGWQEISLVGTQISTHVIGETATLRLSGFTLTITGKGDNDKREIFPLKCPAETLNLRRVNGGWKFVVGSEEQLLTKKLEAGQGGMYATLLQVKFPRSTTSLLKQTDCESSLSQLVRLYGRGDNADVFRWGNSSYRHEIEAEVRHWHQTISCPLVKRGIESYTFNSYLDGLKLDAIKDEGYTVLFYEGKAGKLDFRHIVYHRYSHPGDAPSGWIAYANVGFVDGHTNSYAKNDKELSKLIWKP